MEIQKGRLDYALTNVRASALIYFATNGTKFASKQVGFVLKSESARLARIQA